MPKPAIVAVLMCVLTGPLAAQSPTQTVDPPAIVAQGEAVVREAPDVAWVQIAVEARGAKPEEARGRAGDAMTSVMTALKAHAPAQAIKTSTFTVQPEMDYSNGGPRLRDYVARNQIEVRVDDLDKLTPIMDASVGSGATSISGLRFDVKRRPQAEREALSLAVQDGMARANAIAAGAGRTAGAIIRLQEQRVSGQGIRFAGLAQGGGGGGRGGGAETPITPGEIEIRAVVVLTVAIR